MIIDFCTNTAVLSLDDDTSGTPHRTQENWSHGIRTQYNTTLTVTNIDYQHMNVISLTNY